MNYAMSDVQWVVLTEVVVDPVRDRRAWKVCGSIFARDRAEAELLCSAEHGAGHRVISRVSMEIVNAPWWIGTLPPRRFNNGA